MGLMASNRRTAEEKLRAKGIAADENNQMPSGNEQRELEPALHQTSTEYAGETPILDEALREPTEAGGPHNPIPVPKTFEHQKLNPEMTPLQLREQEGRPHMGYQPGEIQEPSKAPESTQMGMKESEVKAQEVKSKKQVEAKEKLTKQQTERKEELKEMGQEERDLTLNPQFSVTDFNEQAPNLTPDQPLETEEEEIDDRGEKHTKRRRVK